MARTASAVIAVIVLAGTWTALAAEPLPKTDVTGVVVFACPQGKYIKITSGGKELAFPVIGTAQDVVKTLKKDDHVKLTYVHCPKQDKDVVIAAAKIAPNPG